MLTSKFFARSMGILSIAALAVAGFFLANPASAGTGLSATPNFPTPVTVGQTGVAVSLTVANASTVDEGAVTLSSITLVPSCGDSVPGCTTPDTGVFAVSAAGTGHTGTSCDGDAFTIAVTNVGTGQVTFTRTGGSLVLGFNASCQIDFTVDVLKVPASDVSGAAGVQTAQLGAASGISELQNPASGTGTDITTVDKASPGIQTTPSAGGPIGTVLNDTATLTGGSSPTGTVTFKLFPPADPTCAGTASYTDPDATAPYDTATSGGGFVSNAAGVWHWTADYAGDANNNPASSGCEAEPVTISKLGSTTTTEIHTAAEVVVPNNSSVASGTTVHDKATVTGSGPVPTGSVTFTFFSGAGSNVCDAQSVGAGVVALVAGVAHPSDAQGPLSAGSYSFRASYGGDGNYDGSISGCEPFNVDKATPTVTTAIHDANHATITSATSGDTVHDSATVTGSAGTATGDVTFDYFTNGDCSGEPAVTSGTFALSGGTVDATTFTQVVGVSGASFMAHYAGDAAYTAKDGDCEPLTVNKLDSTTVTEIHDANHVVVTSVDEGATVHDSATVTGSGPTPTGNVEFTWFTNGSCDGAGVAAGTVALVAGVAHPSDSEGPLTPGSYSFQAHYVGDSVYNESTGACEPLTVVERVLEYCSPGYWKQDQHFDSWVDYDPTDEFFDVFGRHITIMWSAGGKPQPLTDPTLLQALQANGGGINAYARAAVDALLNASALDSGMTPGEVVSAVQAALDSHNYDTSGFNTEENCPLN